MATAPSMAAMVRAARPWAREAGHPYDGGWGIAGHANTDDELVALARAELAGG